MSDHQQTADIRGTRIAYVDSGPADGEVFVLSHSLFFDHTMFEPLSRLLQQDGHRVIAYDHRGQGASSAADREDLSMDSLTDDAAALIENLNVGPVHFLGNSMGGFVALRLAARRPELLRSAIAGASSAEQEHQLDAFAPLIETIATEGTSAVIDSLMHIMFGDATLAAGGELTESWRSHMLELPNRIADSAHQVIHRPSIVDELNGCRVPVLAISGTEDHAYPPPISDQNIAAASGGSWKRVDAAGHSTTLERPDQAVIHIRAHLAEIAAEPRR